MTPEEEEYSPYCKICTGCGEEGCCSPLGCKMSADGSYCESYLIDLKFSYSLNNLLLKEIYKDQEKYKDLIDFYTDAHKTEFNYWYLNDKKNDTIS